MESSAEADKGLFDVFFQHGCFSPYSTSECFGVFRSDARKGPPIINGDGSHQVLKLKLFELIDQTSGINRNNMEE